jgi:hypothetical protein
LIFFARESGILQRVGLLVSANAGCLEGEKLL